MNLPIKTEYLIVGAGLFGCTLAERLANEGRRTVTVIDKRPHIGGNCYSEEDPITGIEVHAYGPHIFHTSDPTVWNYISRFIELNNYRHTVVAVHNGMKYFLPINLATINAIYGSDFSPTAAEEFIAKEAKATGCTSPQNLEEKALSLIGRPLYEAFIKGYTTKQWGTNPKNLPAETIARLPVRFNYNTNYFNDRWQGVPIGGYTAMFMRMLANPRINVCLNVDYFDICDKVEPYCTTIYTGPIDRFFNYCQGMLGWRTMKFDTYYQEERDTQGAYVVNYVDTTIPYTRRLEYRHAHPELENFFSQRVSVITEEFSVTTNPGDDPYYPVNSKEDKQLLHRYVDMAKVLSRNVQNRIIFGGRLGTYAYLDMGDCIKSALNCYKEIIAR